MVKMKLTKRHGHQTCDSCGREFDSLKTRIWSCPHCGYDNTAGRDFMAALGDPKANKYRRK